MKFSTRTQYGLKGVLALAARYGEGSMAISQIAKKYSISVAYLEQIMNALKKKGIVKSMRGPQGGYVLAKKPSEITLGELLAAFEGKDFFSTPREESAAGPDEAMIANILFWKKFEQAVQEGFSELTLKHLLDEAHALRKKSDPNHTFHI